MLHKWTCQIPSMLSNGFNFGTNYRKGSLNISINFRLTQIDSWSHLPRKCLLDNPIFCGCIG